VQRHQKNVSPDKLKQIEISPSGFGLHFPHIDADLYLPSLLNNRAAAELVPHQR